MWNFVDLAKKAQELQDQAAEAAQSFTAPTTSFFNLDAMQAPPQASSNASNTTSTTGAATGTTVSSSSSSSPYNYNSSPPLSYAQQPPISATGFNHHGAGNSGNRHNNNISNTMTAATTNLQQQQQQYSPYMTTSPSKSTAPSTVPVGQQQQRTAPLGKLKLPPPKASAAAAATTTKMAETGTSSSSTSNTSAAAVLTTTSAETSSPSIPTVSIEHDDTTPPKHDDEKVDGNDDDKNNNNAWAGDDVDVEMDEPVAAEADKRDIPPVATATASVVSVSSEEPPPQSTEPQQQPLPPRVMADEEVGKEEEASSVSQQLNDGTTAAQPPTELLASEDAPDTAAADNQDVLVPNNNSDVVLLQQEDQPAVHPISSLAAEEGNASANYNDMSEVPEQQISMDEANVSTPPAVVMDGTSVAPSTANNVNSVDSSGDMNHEPAADIIVQSEEPPIMEPSDGSTAMSSSLEPPSTPATSKHQNHATGNVQQPPVAATRTKLLLLISSQSINRQVAVRQDLVETALRAAGVEYEALDGALEEHKELRNELFLISGVRGEYPQFFLVDLTHGGTTYWGGWEQFQYTNDDGKLQEAFGCSIPSTPSTPQTPDVRTWQPNVERPDHIMGSTTGSTAPSVPADLLEHFSDQLKRLEENHQMERNEMEQKHARELMEASNHEACLQSRQELENRLVGELRIKDDQIQELCRRNEGYRLKMDVLKREVAGTQELLQARDSDVGKANQKYLNDLRAMEKQLVAAEKKASTSMDDNQELQKALSNAQAELVALKQEHDDLKGRVKTVAAELKERRGECRHWQSKVEELTDLNRNMQATVDSLQEKLNHQGMSQTEKDGEMEELRAKIANADKELKNAEKVWKEREAKSEQTLADYKKKAQNSLSMANARTASAVQAREEAELDARAARATADSAFDRATKAEIASREAVAAAKATVKEREDERDAALLDLQRAKDTVRATEEAFTKLQQKLEHAMAAKESKVSELDRVRTELASEQAQVATYQRKLSEMTNQSNSLRDDVASLREQLFHAKAAVDATETTKKDILSASTSNGGLHQSSGDNADDATLAALRQELREANEAIEDLKAALANAIEGVQPTDHSDANIDDSARDDDGAPSSKGSMGGESIPLFYAMEKQAELKTARTEMNRLASMLADVQSEKTEAYEAMEEMRRRMEDAESRLKRYEKLGSTSTTSNTLQAPTPNGIVPMSQPDSGAVNIEYLKHIMLRFLNAKAVTERKALVPVIGAVLELTPNELQNAIRNVEQSNTSVGSSLLGFLS